MDDLERLLSERACERLLHLYATRIDAYDYDGFVELWAEGGVWNVLGNVMSGLPAKGWRCARTISSAGTS